MFERKEALSLILKGCCDNFEANGFKVSVPENIEKGDAPVFTDERAHISKLPKTVLPFVL